MALDYPIRYCPKCGEIYFLRVELVPVCTFCKTQLIETEFICADSFANGEIKPEIRKAIFEKYIRDNPMYSEEAVKLREEQEHQNRMNLPSSYKPKEKNVPKCPICGSKNLSKITTAHKAGKIALFGIFGMGDNGKTWKCKNCGSKF